MFDEEGIAVYFKNYSCREYEQRFPPFLPYTSSIDSLFNESPQSGNTMRRGREVPFTPNHVRTAVENMGSKREVR